MAKIYSKIVKGGLVVSSRSIRKHDIAINDGKIVRIAPEITNSDAQDIIDARGKYVFPGIIDVHVHPVYVDTIEDCSILGAFGGITTMIHFAYAKPGMKLAETVKKFIEEGRATSHTDFAMHATIFDAKNQIVDIPKCFEFGVTSFKMFMTYAKLKWMTDDYDLAKAMDVISKCGGLAIVHGEDGLAIDYLEDKYANVAQKEVFLKVRPDALEADAIFRALCISEVMCCPLYIAHISAARGLDPIRWARGRGQVVYAETCPQYLTLTDNDLQEKGPLAKIGPPLRTVQDNESLWKGIKDGTIDVIASDHAPKVKRIDDDFVESAFGAPSAETMLAVTYQKGINEGRVDLCTLIRAYSETPARIFGLYPQKGTLEEGSDADLVLFDPAEEHMITHKTQRSHAGYTLFEGFKCLGTAVLTMQRGEIIMEKMEVKSKKGRGIFLPTVIRNLSRSYDACVSCC